MHSRGFCFLEKENYKQIKIAGCAAEKAALFRINKNIKKHA